MKSEDQERRTSCIEACSCEPYEHPVPGESVFTLDHPFMSLNDIHIEESGEDLDIGNLLFLEGGTQVWVDKASDVVWVWPCSRARGREPRPTAYQGTRRPCTCTAKQPISDTES